MKPVVQKIVVGAIIIVNGKVLIIQRSKDEETFPNLWEIPSGKKEPLEDVKTALLREVKEETGMDVEVTEIVDIFNYQVERSEAISDYTQINFLAKPKKSTEVTLSSEHRKYYWVSKDELEDYKTSKDIKAAIRRALDKNTGLYY